MLSDIQNIIKYGNTVLFILIYEEDVTIGFLNFDWAREIERKRVREREREGDGGRRKERERERYWAPIHYWITNKL